MIMELLSTPQLTHIISSLTTATMMLGFWPKQPKRASCKRQLIPLHSKKRWENAPLRPINRQGMKPLNPSRKKFFRRLKFPRLNREFCQLESPETMLFPTLQWTKKVQKSQDFGANWTPR